MFTYFSTELVHNPGTKKSVLSPEAEETLRAQLHLDIQLYDYVNQRLTAQMQMIAGQ